MTIAVEALNRCRTCLRAAHRDAADAETNLAGARLTRASQLVEMIGDCLCIADRLALVVEADAIYEEHR